MPRRSPRTWDERFEALKEYKDEHGDCQIPCRYALDTGLGLFASKLRNNPEKLTEEQRARLDAIGFNWETKRQRDDRVWKERWNQLREYKKKHGSFSFSTEQRKGDFKGLAKFTETQRTLQAKGRLRKDQEELLDSIGFVWAQKKKTESNLKPTEANNQKWLKQFKKLVQFHEENNHCMVPFYYNQDKSLGPWVLEQRQKFRKGDLPEDRRVELDQLGFAWKIDNTDPTKSVAQGKWDQRLALLKAYKEEHGTVEVIAAELYRDIALGRWLTRQRQRARNGVMDSRRMSALGEVGVSFELKETGYHAHRNKLDSLNEDEVGKPALLVSSEKAEKKKSNKKKKKKRSQEGDDSCGTSNIKTDDNDADSPVEEEKASAENPCLVMSSKKKKKKRKKQKRSHSSMQDGEGDASCHSSNIQTEINDKDSPVEEKENRADKSSPVMPSEKKEKKRKRTIRSLSMKGEEGDNASFLTSSNLLSIQTEDNGDSQVGLQRSKKRRKKSETLLLPDDTRSSPPPTLVEPQQTEKNPGDTMTSSSPTLVEPHQEVDAAPNTLTIKELFGHLQSKDGTTWDDKQVKKATKKALKGIKGKPIKAKKFHKDLGKKLDLPDNAAKEQLVENVKAVIKQQFGSSQSSFVLLADENSIARREEASEAPRPSWTLKDFCSNLAPDTGTLANNKAIPKAIKKALKMSKGKPIKIRKFRKYLRKNLDLPKVTKEELLRQVKTDIRQGFGTWKPTTVPVDASSKKNVEIRQNRFIVLS